MALSVEFKEELKARIDIADIISGYTNLKKAGRSLKGLCPFHNEKTPSFNVYTDTQSYYCFGCGAGGDVIKFIEECENLDYMETIRFLADRAGMTVPDDTDVDDSMSKLKNRIREINRTAARFFHQTLISPQGTTAMDYLTNRGLTLKTVRRFGLGYAPESWEQLTKHLKEKGFTNSEIVSANLAQISKYDKPYDVFRNRIMFPIINLRGDIIAFGGRTLGDDKRKYINSSDTPIFKKSSNLYALNFAKNDNDDKLILVEGYMDVISLHQAGFSQAVATLGTAITSEQARLISSYSSEVTIVYDSDAAGRKATDRAIPILRQTDVRVKVLNIPQGKDPDEYIRSHGDSGVIRFKNMLLNAGNDMEYRLRDIKGQYDIETTDGKVQYLNKSIDIISEIKNPAEREIYISNLSTEVQIEKQTIMESVNRKIKKRNISNPKKELKDIQNEMIDITDKVNPERIKNIRASRAEESLIKYMLKNQDQIETISKALPIKEFVTSFNRRVYEFMILKSQISDTLITLMDFSDSFSNEEMRRIAKMIASEEDVSNNRSALRDYINVIKEENAKITPETVKEMSVMEMDAYIKEKSRKKARY